MLKKLISTLLISSAVVLTGAAHAQSPATPTLNAPSAAAPIVPSAPDLAATSYLLIDANSGAVLVENNADNPLPPASLTKMMTSYIVSQEIKRGQIGENDQVLVSEKAWRMGGSKMFIRVGNQVPVIDLLRGVIIQSGNDASIALAEHVAGSEDAFADLMNA
ncbi:MAG: serine-type D-Ala-D-Ala carboxypeptidase, partial [Pseudomonas sp.]|nr:serine-type D-Ala-D-Ala carboxypeptidase [Pseudomonas sp.]